MPSHTQTVNQIIAQLGHDLTLARQRLASNTMVGQPYVLVTKDRLWVVTTDRGTGHETLVLRPPRAELCGVPHRTLEGATQEAERWNEIIRDQHGDDPTLKVEPVHFHDVLRAIVETNERLLRDLQPDHPAIAVDPAPQADSPQDDTQAPGLF